MQRAEPLLRANGVDPHRMFGATALGRANLLTGAHRAGIIRSGDEVLSWPG